MQDLFAARVIGQTPVSMIYELGDSILDQAAAKFCPFGLRVIATIRKEMNMPGKASDARQQEVATEAPPPPPIPVVAGAAAAAAAAFAPEAIKAANKVIDMIRDKEIRDRVQSGMNAIKVEILEAANEFLENYVYALKGRKLKPAQQKQIDDSFEECKKKFQEAIDAAREGAEAANAGKEEVAKEDFAKAEKKAHEAAEAFKALTRKKERMIMDNAPAQDPEESTPRKRDYR